jgi:hypothetical protein
MNTDEEFYSMVAAAINKHGKNAKYDNGPRGPIVTIEWYDNGQNFIKFDRAWCKVEIGITPAGSQSHRGFSLMPSITGLDRYDQEIAEVKNAAQKILDYLQKHKRTTLSDALHRFISKF